MIAEAVSMPFKRAGWLQPLQIVAAHRLAHVSMPFKRAGWLQHGSMVCAMGSGAVSMPFKRAGWLQPQQRKLRRAEPTRFNAL